jgi:hypothetical protein
MLGKDGRAYGPLPREWTRYKGAYKHGDRIITSYSVGDADMLESHSVDIGDRSTVWTRTVNVGESTHDLTMRVAPEDQADAAVSGGLTLESDQG